MKSICFKCGHNLPRIAFFYCHCKTCGSRYRAVRNKKMIWLNAIYGTLPFLLIPSGIIIGLPAVYSLIVIPLICILSSIFISKLVQEWAPCD